MRELIDTAVELTYALMLWIKYAIEEFSPPLANAYGRFGTARQNP